MAEQDGRLEYGPGESVTLRGLPLHESDPLDILVGKTWVTEYIHYEVSNGNWYCDAGSIPLYAGREARFRLELVPQDQGDEEDLMLASSRELGELYEEEFEDEQWDCQAASCSCSRDTRLASREEERVTRSAMSQLHQRKPLWTCPQGGRQFANQNQSHACAHYTLAEPLEGKSPEVLAL